MGPGINATFTKPCMGVRDELGVDATASQAIPDCTFGSRYATSRQADITHRFPNGFVGR